MVPAMHRPAQINVDLGAIKENIKNEVKHLKDKQQLWAVVKANAYGHGAIPVANAALQAGATGFCVATLDEGLELREYGIPKPVLVLGIVPVQWTPLAAQKNISLTVGSLEWLKAADKILAETNQALKIHLGIDSGMGRIGFSEDDEFIAANKFLQDNPHFEVEGMFTHFSKADDADTSYFDYQVKRFKHMQDLLTIKPKYIHVANTATSIFNRKIDSDIVRFGIGIYGLNPSSTPNTDDLPSEVPLKPALSFTSALSFVKQIHKGYGVGYGATFVADKDQWIGTVPVGYADGWQRKMQGFKVKVGDEYCPIVGRVCMDQFMVLLPHKMSAGTPVELISADPTAPNNIKAVADQADTIHYEIACLLSDRLPRVYKD
ncbi:alanine racemase [Lactobacillus sp. PV034]|uniref:alanine racemase n=1 Tax=Lactobacillus sp. PV034 TaxID=2594495 RepID=UPI00223F869D|nr:alanine racemase [Lactobacillus sp. PV034]QNQ81328.1 alanine racemase [Lactobacillus sp. PV034]